MTDTGIGTGTENSVKNDGIQPNTPLNVDNQGEGDIFAHCDNPISPAISGLIPADIDSELFLEFPDVVALDASDPQTGGWPGFDQMTWDADGLGSQLAIQEICNPKAIQDISAKLQTEDTLSFTFPDDRVLAVPSLTLLNAATKVAQRLNVSNLIWDLSAISPFYQESPAASPSSILPRPFYRTPSQGSDSLSVSSRETASGPTNFDALPPHLRPTPTQRLIPHHPILDLLPWPNTRNKLIQVFNLPAELRPGSAQDPMALIRLVHDLEDDSGEGVRISGRDPFEFHAWEIGQIMLERWWWAFDIGVVETSNRARVNRGEKRLTLTGQGL